jgi:prepilin-type N-terminal cleavage/methylation domain-containing protein
MTRCSRRKPGFSLVELVVVIVIIGILAAIAIPRLSRGSQGASQSSLAMNLTTVRNAISMFAAEHNSTFPGPDAAGFVDQLTKATNFSGSTTIGANQRKYGPYLLAIPACPVGVKAGENTVKVVSGATPEPDDSTGWLYNKDTGEFLANTVAQDDTGKAYKLY